jgi:ligand-binding SRPBCC domain-containing protein
MRQFEHTEFTTATAEQIWPYYADPTRWPEWDHALAKASLDGPLVVGTSGRIHPVKGPRVSFTMTEVTAHRSFSDVTRFPFARITFTHVIAPTDSGCQLTHRFQVTGPLAPVFGVLIGRAIAAELPTAMRTLARLAETSHSPQVL